MAGGAPLFDLLPSRAVSQIVRCGVRQLRDIERLATTSKCIFRFRLLFFANTLAGYR